MPSNTKRQATKQEIDAPPIPRERSHPDENSYYDAFLAQVEAKKFAFDTVEFIQKENSARVRGPHGHDIITQREVAALRSSLLCAAHIGYMLRRRLERGALVEDGPFCLGHDRFYRQENEIFRADPALRGNCGALADACGLEVLRHDPDLGYDPASADWWPIVRGSDDDRTPEDTGE